MQSAGCRVIESCWLTVAAVDAVVFPWAAIAAHLAGDVEEAVACNNHGGGGCRRGGRGRCWHRRPHKHDSAHVSLASRGKGLVARPRPPYDWHPEAKNASTIGSAGSTNRGARHPTTSRMPRPRLTCQMIAF